MKLLNKIDKGCKTMREFKFRAWDNGKMHSVSFNNLSVNNHHPDGQRIMRDEMRPFGVSHKTLLMQYTGLKDKNGKEIYEGDIVGSFIPNRESTGAIIDYDDEITVFYDIRNANEQFVFLLEPRVIGNIYENPELLVR